MDPDGNNFDLSTNGYDMIRPDRVTPLKVKRMPPPVSAPAKKKSAGVRKTARKRA
jgi:hypothetical protein